MSFGKTLTFGTLAALAIDAGEDVYKGESPKIGEWLISGRAASVIESPAFDTHQGQTRLYRVINDPANPNDDQWGIAHLEVNGQTLTFDTNRGDSLQQETDAAGNTSLRIGVRYGNKRFYAVLSVPPVDRDGDGIADQHLTPAGAYTESTTFFEQAENHIDQQPGTDTVIIRGRAVNLP